MDEMSQGPRRDFRLPTGTLACGRGSCGLDRCDRGVGADRWRPSRCFLVGVTDRAGGTWAVADCRARYRTGRRSGRRAASGRRRTRVRSSRQLAALQVQGGAADIRQRHVHHRDVQDEHQLRGCDPASATQRDGDRTASRAYRSTAGTYPGRRSTPARSRQPGVTGCRCRGCGPGTSARSRTKATS